MTNKNIPPVVQVDVGPVQLSLKSLTLPKSTTSRVGLGIVAVGAGVVLFDQAKIANRKEESATDETPSPS
ncbi:hypothetical protein ACEZDB_32300 [Streptacidiphilus sp. N1-3]|uniref:Gram-positive cocci surface proteins LPxTG domain-containing protein n=1 Tax=Streptacidiphilus alkalitolerans TaxID=3342712 RepID=A0ABV6XAZ3_9ACTN